MKSEAGSIFSSSTLAKSTYKDLRNPLQKTIGSLNVNRGRGYASVNRSAMFTEKFREKRNITSSLILDKYNQAYDSSIHNEKMVKTTIDAIDRSPKLKRKLFRSIESISKGYEK